MAVIIEKFDSRETTVGVENPSVDLLYMVDGTEDDAAVRAIVEATIPAMYAGLVFQNYHIAHQGGGLWEVSVRYGKKEPKEPGQSSFSFDTGGGTTHMTQSLETVNSYALPGEDPPDFKGAIGVNNDSVEGTDITIPVYNFKETHYIPVALVTPAYKAALCYLTGKVNAFPFKGFAPGEVLFQGASSSQRGTEASQFFRQSGIVKLRNTSGADQARFAVLALSEPIVGPLANLQEFKNKVVFEGGVPDDPPRSGGAEKG